MALQSRNVFKKLRVLIKSEIIWKRVIRSEPLNIYKYKVILKELNINEPNVKDYLYFPSASFKSCPTDILESLISDSLEIVKEKKLINKVEVYNSILRSYVENNINFDVDKFLQEMRDNQIKFNQETYSLFIEYYCNIGKMDNVEILLKESDSQHKENYFIMIKGYIIAGQPEKSKKLIEDNHFNENDSKVSFELMKGYSSIGQIDMVMDIINNMKEDKFLSNMRYFTLYQRLALSNAPDSDLEKILMASPNPLFYNIQLIIIRLNRSNLFDHSLKLLEKYEYILRKRIMISDVIRSFNSKNCSKEIYLRALIILLKYQCDAICSNLFANLNYSDIVIFLKTIINNINSKHIVFSLVNKSINEKAIDQIEISLKFAFKNLTSKGFHNCLVFNYIPLMLEKGITSNLKELIDLLPDFQKDVSLASLMYCLIKRDFEQFTSLRVNYQYRNVHYMIHTQILAKELVQNYKSMNDYNRFALNLKLLYNWGLVESILSNVIIEKIIYSSETGDIDGIKDATKLTNNFNVWFKVSQLNYLMENALEYKDVYKCLFERILTNEPISNDCENEIMF